MRIISLQRVSINLDNISCYLDNKGFNSAWDIINPSMIVVVRINIDKIIITFLFALHKVLVDSDFDSHLYK